MEITSEGCRAGVCVNKVGVARRGSEHFSGVVLPPELTLFQLHFTRKDHTIKLKKLLGCFY